MSIPDLPDSRTPTAPSLPSTTTTPADTTMQRRTLLDDDNFSVRSIQLSPSRSERDSPVGPPTPSPTAPATATPNFFEHTSKDKDSATALASAPAPATVTAVPETKKSPVLPIAPETQTTKRNSATPSDMTSITAASNPFDTDADSAVTRGSSISPPPEIPSQGSSSPKHFEATYPPTPVQAATPDGLTASGLAKKSRPESLLVSQSDDAVILGIALVDFNHLVGPKIEWSQGKVFENQSADFHRVLPFLALPDGAHMASEDYSYFHLVPSSPNPKTVFGISCNRQIDSSSLLVKDVDVTRSVVQKAIVVVASKPIFGAIRDKLGVVTRAYFEQRNFSQTNLLSDFYSSLETTVRGQLTESTLHFGTNLRALVRAFRHRTLVLLKALMAQKKILFYGHPVEQLCTYQYSLVSLIPGLLHSLQDCGSPPLASRAANIKRPNELRTSDRKSLLAYLGLPLDIFGKDAFFQPYLPLQQLELLQETDSWLCGSTNTIIATQKDIDIVVNIQDHSFEFRNPAVEKIVQLTAADRVWIDEIVREVNDSWDDADPSKPTHLQFKGSEDYLRTKFEEYIFAALSSIRYAQFLNKGARNSVIISPASASDASSWLHFHPGWIDAFKKTNAYEVWDRVTDPMLFDIIEPRHPGSNKATAIADLGIRLQEGIHELKLEQQLAPTKEAITYALATGSTNLYKAFDGVRTRWQTARRPSISIRPGFDNSLSPSPTPSSLTSTPVDVPKELPAEPGQTTTTGVPRDLPATPTSLVNTAGTRISSWGVGLGSFISSRAPRFRVASSPTSTPSPSRPDSVDGMSIKSGHESIKSLPPITETEAKKDLPPAPEATSTPATSSTPAPAPVQS